ncbi:MAG TPA: hypothetical protein ENJ18_16860 [Nannocystis exedens]|nr:hypothetical protein [Nannocystis exedens]
MSLSTPLRALRRFAPALALLALTTVLLLRAGSSSSALLMLLALPIATELAVAAFAKRDTLISAAALPTVCLGALAIGPTMLPPEFPLWLLGLLVAALPRRGSAQLHGLLGVLVAAATALGLWRADSETMMIITAVVMILSVTLLSASSGPTIAAETSSATIDDLRKRLEIEVQSGRELRQQCAELERDVENRLISLQTTNRSLENEVNDLRSAKEQALEASRIKSSFLANVSHELRTPLNAIIGYSEMLLEEAEERKATASANDQRSVLKAAQNLLKIVNDVLDLTKIEAGKLDVQAEVFEVVELVETLGNTILPLARRNNNTVKLKYSRDLGYIRTDRTKLNRVLLDLLTNACKFTHDGRIELRVDAVVDNDRRFFVFSVSDTGIGISEAMIGHLFEPFRMADESSTREYSGLGLGLALARHFSEMLGGEISVESKLGEGSVFKVRLPVEPADPRELGHILVSVY